MMPRCLWPRACTAVAVSSGLQPRRSMRRRPRNRVRGGHMAQSVYKIIELVGTSPESREKAASAAVAQAAKSLRDLRVAEVSQLDLALEGGRVKRYRAKVKLSFKYENHD